MIKKKRKKENENWLMTNTKKKQNATTRLEKGRRSEEMCVELNKKVIRKVK